jgi:hypothetical protein
LSGEYGGGFPREFEFLELLDKVLPKLLGANEIVREPTLGRNARPDFIAQLDNGDIAIIEAKSVSPNTRLRLSSMAEQLSRYVQAYLDSYPDGRRPKTVLAVSGTLSPEHLELLRTHGIDTVLDGPQIQAALESEGDTEQASGANKKSSSAVRAADELIERLKAVAPGRKQWSSYQTVCGDVLSLVLCPPLARPIPERSNRSGVNRRDFIFPNYAAEGFWEYMRTNYQAHYVVVDAKNYVGRVKKNDVLQLANYLTAHGAGLFGLIITRDGGDRGAEVTRREQWVIHGKLIIVLNDDDLKQMFTVHMSGQDPTDVVRQKIEDFRLGF